MTPDEIKYNKVWIFPKPKNLYTSETFSATSSVDKVSQQKFYDEYHVSGHQIFNSAFYKDIPIYETDAAGKEVLKDYKHVDRIAFPIQFESIDIILAHVLGNHTQFIDSTVGDNNPELMSQYKEFWDLKNMDTFRNDFVKAALSVGDVAGLFYLKENEVKCKILSFLDNEQIYVKNDKYGELEYFGRFYSIMESNKLVSYCDIIDKRDCITYSQGENAVWTIIPSLSGVHGFNRIPVVYHFRKGGAFWTPVQNNIDKLEIMVSELSEDNHSKTRSLYHIGTDKPESVQAEHDGGVDTVITDANGVFTMVQGADISTQFVKTYDILMERIMNPLGMVYPKSKSSGDMPTGSMKMMFYPTERVGIQIIHEFNAPLDKINSLFKIGMAREKTELASELATFNVSAAIRMFTPQDDSSVMTALGQAKQYGSLSDLTIAQNMPFAANDESRRLDEQSAEAAKALAEQQSALALDTPPPPSTAAKPTKETKPAKPTKPTK